MKGNILWLTALLSVTSIATAKEAISTVDVKQCDKVAGTTSPFILVLKTDQPIMESITNCATKAKLTGASFSGIGQVEKPILAYYNLDTNRYQYKNYQGTYELVSLNGNISLLNGKQEPHAHAVISDDQYNVSGGHLNEAFTAATIEITIIPLKRSPIKKRDKETGLNIMVTE